MSANADAALCRPQPIDHITGRIYVLIDCLPTLSYHANEFLQQLKMYPNNQEGSIPASLRLWQMTAPSEMESRNGKQRSMLSGARSMKFRSHSSLQTYITRSADHDNPSSKHERDIYRRSKCR